MYINYKICIFTLNYTYICSSQEKFTYTGVFLNEITRKMFRGVAFFLLSINIFSF